VTVKELIHFLQLQDENALVCVQTTDTFWPEPARNVTLAEGRLFHPLDKEVGVIIKTT
jgi:hypothetical protein